MKDRILLTVKLIVLAAIIYWLATSFDQSQWETLKNQPKHWGLLATALLLVLAETIFSFLRWMVLVRTLGIPLSCKEAIRLGFLGYLFNLVSAGSVGGDLFKAVAVSKNRESKRPELLASVLMDRVVGLVGLLIVACISLEFFAVDALPTALQIIRRGALLFAAISLSGLIAIVIFGRHLPLRWLKKIPWVGNSLRRMATAGLIFDGRPGLLAFILGISIVVHFGLTGAMCLISNALYTTPPTMAQHFIVIPPAVVAGALPLTPGGLGVQEGAIHQLFREMPGVDNQFSGMVIAAMYRLMTFCVAGVGAIYYFAGIGQPASQKKQNTNPADQNAAT